MMSPPEIQTHAKLAGARYTARCDFTKLFAVCQYQSLTSLVFFISVPKCAITRVIVEVFSAVAFVFLFPVHVALCTHCCLIRRLFAVYVTLSSHFPLFMASLVTITFSHTRISGCCVHSILFCFPGSTVTHLLLSPLAMLPKFLFSVCPSP